MIALPPLLLFATPFCAKVLTVGVEAAGMADSFNSLILFIGVVTCVMVLIDTGVTRGFGDDAVEKFAGEGGELLFWLFGWSGEKETGNTGGVAAP